jgi:hypothetical protein
MKTLTQNLIIPATTGKRTIAKASGVFPGWIDSYFKNRNLDNPGEKTEELKVKVQEMDKDATFAQIFTKPEEMCLTQSQIIYFCEGFPQQLRTDGYATFFLFKEKNGEYFVASVYFDGSGQLEAYVYGLSHDYVWSAGDRGRVVLPQLTVSTSESSDTQTLKPSVALDLAIAIIQEAGYLIVKGEIIN